VRREGGEENGTDGNKAKPKPTPKPKPKQIKIN
jgi:hypothetical protein